MPAVVLVASRPPRAVPAPRAEGAVRVLRVLRSRRVVSVDAGLDPVESEGF